MNFGQKLRDVSRLEIIHVDEGRMLVSYGVQSIDVQDSDRTLKVFLDHKSTVEPVYNTAEYTDEMIQKLIGLLKKEKKTPKFKEVFGINKLRSLHETWQADSLNPEFKELSLAVLRSTNMRPEYADGLCRHFHDENGKLDFDGLMAKVIEYREIKKTEGDLLNKHVFPKMSRTNYLYNENHLF